MGDANGLRHWREEPLLAVGLMPRSDDTELAFDGEPFTVIADGEPVATVHDGTLLSALRGPGGVRLEHLDDGLIAAGRELMVVPREPERSSFLLRGMTVGVRFHWQHEEDLRFRGALRLDARDDGLDVVNLVPLETYLTSVISSEMSARCPGALLRAHAVISRSWLLAQLDGRAAKRDGGGGDPATGAGAPRPPVRALGDDLRLWRWYDREDHADFDVCADDHCQRYQGITRASSEAAAAAVAATRGEVLVAGGAICDARFSKCCGGVTELFSSAWGDEDPSYLRSFVDADGEPALDGPLTDEVHATAFIEGAPPAWCNTDDRALLDRVLPALDHATTDFHRWEQILEQDELQRLLRDEAEVDLGAIRALRPLRRGPSGRIVELAIDGERGTLTVGKELEIRRVLSPTHLYSSAFVVRASDGAFPARFVLRGAGWGHGVGLCQIGAAVMADRGHDHAAILAHYYRGAERTRLYR